MMGKKHANICDDYARVVGLIRALQPVRDSFNVGTSERNSIQSVINFLIGKFNIDCQDVQCTFTTGPDMVNKPPHYNIHAMECFDEMVTIFGARDVFTYCVLNAWKYRYRADAKGNPEQDNAKADWYIAKAKELNDAYSLGMGVEFR